MNKYLMQVIITTAIFFLMSCGDNEIVIDKNSNLNSNNLEDELNIVDNEDNYIFGKYIGQIDSNSIEIEVLDSSDGLALKVFFLEENFKNDFEAIGIKESCVVKIKYEINNKGQKVVKQIKVSEN